MVKGKWQGLVDHMIEGDINNPWGKCMEKIQVQINLHGQKIREYLTKRDTGNESLGFLC